jgi:type IV secretory pathway TraG/TraD family ATPase VirD4
MAKQEKTIEEKQRLLRKDALLGGILLTIVLTYLSLSIQAYMADHPRADLAEALQGISSVLAKNPFYFFPITYNIGVTLALDMLAILFLFVGYSYNKLRVHHDINTLKGSSKWADLNELIKKFADFEGKNYKTAYNNAILSENMQMSINQKKHFHALNTLILGATGSGKSRYFLKPNLLQMNCSYVITDPSGGILQENGETLRRFGYHIRVFDLVQMGNCDTYNPLKYCHRESDIKKIVQAFIKNTDGSGGKGGSKDPFWDDSMNAFMCACIGLLTTCPKGSDIPYGQIPEITGMKDTDGGSLVFSPVFATLCELTRMANKKWDSSSNVQLYEGVKLGDGKNNTANASELAAIFENLRVWEANRQGVSLEDMVKPYCLREWENFRIAPEKTSTTILMTTAVRLDPFNIEQVKDLTSTDTLDLDNFGASRDILFIITPTNDRTYNFLVSFLYTQLFDLLYVAGETKSAGSLDVKLPCGELVHHFTKEEVAADKGMIDKKIEALKNLSIKKVEGGGMLHGAKTVKKKTWYGKTKKIKVKEKFFDGWYDILDADGELVSRRPTKALAESYVAAAKEAKTIPGNGKSVPTHVRFLMDEFPNLGEIPEFKEKLATMRKYEISCTVICQTITQLKGMYEKDYEVVDANCPQKVFLGGDENSNNEYLSKKIGTGTVKGWNDSVDSKKVNMSYNVESKELMRPEDLGRIPFEDEIVLIYGEDPIYDKKYDYPKHKNYKYTHDYACDLGLYDAVVYDRSKYAALANMPIMIKVEGASAVPSIGEFTAEVFKKVMGCTTVEDASQKAKTNVERHSLESASQAMAF